MKLLADSNQLASTKPEAIQYLKQLGCRGKSTSSLNDYV